MSTPSFDYAIVGAGAAGLHLAIKMARDPFFDDKRILILDKDPKTANDRTFSFWEKGTSVWDEIACKTWQQLLFHGGDNSVEIQLKDYSYKTIRSSAFYSYAKEVIREHPQIQWVKDDIKDVKDGRIIGGQRSYQAHHIFDSRVSPTFKKEKSQHISLSQHFLGWFIETEAPVFDEETVTIMDYRLKWKDHTSFTYILPFSPTYALVEFTLFNQELLTTEEYEHKLKAYISDYLGIKHYSIKEIERGCIPMSNYPFVQDHASGVTKIGTAGGWVRPSSGYSFKNGDRYSQMILDNIKAGRTPHHRVAKSRFRHYDSIFLRVLEDRNDLGEKIFHTLYGRHDIQSLFRFLDEESTLLEDLRVMFSLNHSQFRKAFLASF